MLGNSYRSTFGVQNGTIWGEVWMLDILEDVLCKDSTRE